MNHTANMSGPTLLEADDGQSVEVDDYQYEYDFTESFDNYDWSELVPAVVVYSVILLLGICGNALIICTITRYRRLKTVTNTFLASLASADLLLVLICVPVNVAKLFSYTWTFGVFLCKFVHYMQNVSAICSVLTLTAMSIERYYAIVHPMKAQYLCTVSQAKKVISATWVLSFILAMPTLWIQIQLPVGERVPAYWCVRDWNNPLGWQIYELYMLILVLLLPTIIMAGAYGAIGREIWKVTALRSTMINEPAVNEGTSAAAAAASAPTGAAFDAPEAADLPDVVGAEATEVLNAPAVGAKVGVCGRPICSRTSNRAALSRAQTDHRTAKQVVKMLVAVVLLFVICWSPYLIDNVLMSFEILPSARTGTMKHMRIAFHLLSYINSCINPLVYGFMSRNFRRGFKAALRLRSARGFPLCCCYCASCYPQNNRLNRQRPIYKFSQVSRFNSRTQASLRFNEPGYPHSSFTHMYRGICVGRLVDSKTGRWRRLPRKDPGPAEHLTGRPAGAVRISHSSA